MTKRTKKPPEPRTQLQTRHLLRIASRIDPTTKVYIDSGCGLRPAVLEVSESAEVRSENGTTEIVVILRTAEVTE